MTDFSLRGRTVLLTGGAGLYGKGLARALANTGCRLVMASRNVEALETVADSLRSEGRAAEIRVEALDQGQEGSVCHLLERLQGRFDRLDGLVNNAVARPMSGAGAPGAEWEASMQVNATGMFHMHRYFGGWMAEQGGGSIVNIGSIQGMVGPSPDLYAGTDMGLPPPDYFFHKAGLLNLTRYYAAQWGGRGVRVNCLSPGGFFNHQPQPFLGRYEERTALGRMADDRDLGGPTIFLLSDAARYVTGANLPVDGGYTAR